MAGRRWAGRGAPPPPGPRGHWLWGSLPDVRRDMPGTLLEVARRYGGVTRLRMGPASMYLVTRPDLIVELIVDRAGEVRKSRRTGASLRGHLGRGLVTLEGSEHRRHRRLVQPAMHTQRMAGQAEAIVDITRSRVDRWPDGASIILLDEMADLTLRIVGATLFGLAADDEADPLVCAVREFAESLNRTLRQAFPTPTWVPTGANRARRQAVRRIDHLAYQLIQRRRRSGGEGDLLSGLVAARAGGSSLSDVEVRDELMTMFFAGHETSAAALTWALHLLDRHPDVAARLRAEIAAAVGDAPVTGADLARLPLLDQVVRETLRLYPPAWVFDRSPVHDLVLGGYAIDRGATILVSPWVAHRDPEVWDDPDEFRPERFTGEQPPRGAYLPFGDGPRLCVGNRFAELEIALVLATVLPRVELSGVDAGPARPVGDATLRPAGGLPVVVRRRR